MKKEIISVLVVEIKNMFSIGGGGKNIISFDSEEKILSVLAVKKNTYFQYWW